MPSSFDLAGWHDGSANPGDPGKPTVILGHVDSSSGPAVFFRLKDLGPGDDIWIKREDRVWVRYVVDRIAQIPKSEFPTMPVYGPQDGVTLRLVTCGGAFDDRTLRRQRDRVRDARSVDVEKHSIDEVVVG